MGEMKKEVKPKLLDLEDFVLWIERTQDEMYKRRGMIDGDELNELIKNEVKRRIRGTCYQFLRYKNKPALFAEEQFQIDWEYDRLTGTYVVMWENDPIEYNHWLFNQVFRDILDPSSENENCEESYS